MPLWHGAVRRVSPRWGLDGLLVDMVPGVNTWLTPLAINYRPVGAGFVGRLGAGGNGLAINPRSVGAGFVGLLGTGVNGLGY